ncbi:MAG: hypothetical protein JXR49_05240 [Acidobacteria bacterium]|nr:hypothetical protein [Acidobacteriota bacterium]
MMQPNGLIDKILDTGVAGKICAALGIDLRQYKILQRLFNTLSNRLEFMNTSVDQSKMVGFYALFSIFLSIPVLFHPPIHRYLLISIGASMFLLLMNIFQDAANSLMNPDEATILAHQPIRGTTYVAAKLTHLLTIVSVVVPSLNLVPALAGLFLTQAHWYYPITHLFAAYLAGLFIAFFVCGIYGWLFLFIAPARLKNIVLWMQLIIFMLFMMSSSIRPLLMRHERIAAIVTEMLSSFWMPWQWFVAIGLLGHVEYDWWMIGEALTGCICTIVLIAFGLRAFKADYLIKTSSLLQGKAAPAASTLRVSRLGVLVRKITGAPSGYGAFTFLGIMCRRDWNFRRLVLMYGASFLIFGLVAAIAGIGTSPLASATTEGLTFSTAHFFPHFLGLTLVIACFALSYTSEPKGAAVFINNPISNYRVFVKGIFLSPWIFIIVLPHLLLIGPCMWSWGVSHAALFFTYSIALSSFYLALAFFFVEGFPFVNAFKQSRSMEMTAPLMGSMALMGILGVIQWFLFRSMPLALAAMGVAAVMAIIALLISMRRMEEKAHRNLQLLNLSPQNIFKESD